jgi:hypothetical protein
MLACARLEGGGWPRRLPDPDASRRVAARMRSSKLRVLVRAATLLSMRS